MDPLENGKKTAESFGGEFSFEFQSRDLPSRRLLGKGLSGIGYETAWKGARYARKDFVGVQRHVFLREAAVLVGLKDHKNVVKTYGWTVDKRSCSLVLEYMDEDLLSLLQKRKESKQGVTGQNLSKQPSPSTQPLDLPEAVEMMLQIATAMEHLHDQGVAHGDLKTKNILVTLMKDGDQKLKVVKVIDFGLVETKRKSKYIVSRKVRKLDLVRWKAPEYLKILDRTLNSSNNDEDETSSESESESTPSSLRRGSSAPGASSVNPFAADVYSFALICSQILTGRVPYPDLDWKGLMAKVLSGLRPDIPDACHPLLTGLLTSCWGDPGERPSFPAILMELERVQALLTKAMGKRLLEAAKPSVTESLAHLGGVPLSREVGAWQCAVTGETSGTLKRPAIVASARTMSPLLFATARTLRRSSLGELSRASAASSLPAALATPPAPQESCDKSRSLVDIVPASERTQSEGPVLVELSDDDSLTDLESTMKRSTDFFLSKLPVYPNFADFNYSDEYEDLAPQSTSAVTLSLLPGNFHSSPTSSTSNLSELRSDTWGSEVPLVVQSCWTRRSNKFVNSSSDSNNEMSIGLVSNPVRKSFLRTVIEHEGSTFRTSDDSASDITTGSVDTGNAMASASAFTRFPSEGGRRCGSLLGLNAEDVNAKTKSQRLLRRSLEFPYFRKDFHRVVYTDGIVAQNTKPEARKLIPDFKFIFTSDSGVKLHSVEGNCRSGIKASRSQSKHARFDELALHHKISERRTREKLSEKFTALRRLVPDVLSKSDKASVLSDTIIYLKGLQDKVEDLQASNCHVQSLYEDLKSSHQDLEQRIKQLEASKNPLGDNWDFKLSPVDDNWGL